VIANLAFDDLSGLSDHSPDVAVHGAHSPFSRWASADHMIVLPWDTAASCRTRAIC
jgi:hypothetical protein